MTTPTPAPAEAVAFHIRVRPRAVVVRRHRREDCLMSVCIGDGCGCEDRPVLADALHRVMFWPRDYCEMIADKVTSVLHPERNDLARIVGAPPKVRPAAQWTASEWRQMYMALLAAWSAVCDAAGVEGDSAPSEVIDALRGPR